MTRSCPCCNGTGAIENLPMFSRHRHRRIYDAVAEATGTGIGISNIELAAHMYEPNEEATPGVMTVLRVHICDMNKILLANNQRIIGRSNLYYLDSRENENAEWDSNKAWKTAKELAKKEAKKEGNGRSRPAS